MFVINQINIFVHWNSLTQYCHKFLYQKFKYNENGNKKKFNEKKELLIEKQQQCELKKSTKHDWSKNRNQWFFFWCVFLLFAISKRLHTTPDSRAKKNNVFLSTPITLHFYWPRSNIQSQKNVYIKFGFALFICLCVMSSKYTWEFDARLKFCVCFVWVLPLNSQELNYKQWYTLNTHIHIYK